MRCGPCQGGGHVDGVLCDACGGSGIGYCCEGACVDQATKERPMDRRIEIAEFLRSRGEDFTDDELDVLVKALDWQEAADGMMGRKAG